MPWKDGIRTVEVEPSLYTADLSRLGEQCEVLLRAGARILHFDVGDGHFVPPITMGPIVLQSIAPLVHRLLARAARRALPARRPEALSPAVGVADAAAAQGVPLVGGDLPRPGGG